MKHMALALMLFISSTVFAGPFDMQTGSGGYQSAYDRLNNTNPQTEQMILRYQQMKIQQQQIQLQQHQLNEQQQNDTQRKLETIKSSLYQLPENARNKAVDEIDSLTGEQRAKLLSIIAAGYEEDRVKFFWFLANISPKGKQELIEKLSKL